MTENHGDQNRRRRADLDAPSVTQPPQVSGLLEAVAKAAAALGLQAQRQVRHDPRYTGGRRTLNTVHKGAGAGARVPFCGGAREMARRRRQAERSRR